jgi:PIN domain nuclease of toxin-antitoxin system
VRLLCDTHILVWAAGDDHRLSAEARRLITSSENEMHYSVASLWEITIKHGLKRQNFDFSARAMRSAMLANGYHELAISCEHALAIDMLPHLHKDPFDRLLVAQAMLEDLTLLTADETVSKYPGSIRLV